MKVASSRRRTCVGSPTTLAALSVVAAGAILLAAPRAAAEEIVCSGNLVGRTLDNVVVTGNCTLTRSTVQGNIVVRTNGVLLVMGSTIIGNVQSDGARRIRLLADPTAGRETRVNGSIQITGTMIGFTSVLQDVRVGGSIQLVSNGGAMNVFGNVVGQDMQVFQNLAVVRLRDNTINGNLQCKQNQPPPRNGGANVVGGDAEGQCAGFER